MSKSGKAVATALEKVDTTTKRALEGAARNAALVQSGQRLGAIRVTQNLGQHISAQSFRALILFRDEKDFEALGFARFDDFLNQHPDSPMTKNQFYDRLNALEREGDSAFDLLNSLGIPISARKQLGDGDVRVDGETVLIGSKDGEIAIPLNDGKRVTEVLRELASNNAQQKRTIDRGKKELTTAKRKIDEAKRAGASGRSPFDQALAMLLGGYTALIEEVGKLPEAEKEKRYHAALPLIAGQRMLLEEAFGFESSNGHHLPEASGNLDELFD